MEDAENARHLNLKKGHFEDGKDDHSLLWVEVGVMGRIGWTKGRYDDVGVAKSDWESGFAVVAVAVAEH